VGSGRGTILLAMWGPGASDGAGERHSSRRGRERTLGLRAGLAGLGLLVAASARPVGGAPPPAPVVSIRLLCVVAADDDPAAPTFTKDFRAAQLPGMVAELNTYYAPVGVRFLLDAPPPTRGPGAAPWGADIQEVHDTGINRGGVVGTMRRLRFAAAHPERLVVFFRDGEGAHVGPESVVFWKGAYAPTLAHELGHFFGLPHTFANDPASIEDAAEKIRAYVEEGGHPRDHGLDVFDGDLDCVDDTPPCMQGAIWKAVWPDQGGEDGVARMKGRRETAGFPVKLPVKFHDGSSLVYTYRHLEEVRRNFMSYWGVAPFGFSPGQIRVMRRTLVSGAHLRFSAAVGFSDSIAEQVEGCAIAAHGEDVRVFATDAGGVLHAGALRVTQAGAVTAEWTSMGDHNGANVACAPAAKWRSDTTLDLVAMGDGVINKVGGRGWWPSPTTWSGIGVWTVRAPAVASTAPTRLDVFARAIDGTVVSKPWTEAHQAWPAWRRLGGSGAGAPAVAETSDRVILAIRTAQRTIAVKVVVVDPLEPSRDRGAGEDDRWNDLGGSGYDDPAVAIVDGGALVAARFEDGSVRVRPIDAEGHATAGWGDLGIRAGSRPALVGGAAPRVVVRRPDGGVSSCVLPTTLDERLTWTDLGSTARAAPIAARIGPAKILVVVRVRDGGLSARVLSAGASVDTAQGEWSDLGFPR